MPSIEKRGSIFRIRDRDESGKLHVLVSGLKSRKECEQWIEARNGKQALAAGIDAWAAANPGPWALRLQERLATVATREGWVYLSDINLKAIVEYRQRGYVWNDLVGLLGILRWLNTHLDYEVDSKVLAFKPQKDKAERMPAPLLTEEQVADIKEAAAFYGEKAMALIDYLLTYGARPITAARGLESDIDMFNCKLGIYVKRKKRLKIVTHPIQPDEAERWLDLPRCEACDVEPHGLQPRHGRPLFCHYKENRPWRINEYGSTYEMRDWYINTVSKRSKLPTNVRSIYRLKDYAITRMLDCGLTLKQVAKFTGHASLTTLQKYERMNEDRDLRALSMMNPRTELPIVIVDDGGTPGA